ncbi:MAG: Ig-like domain-containing protein [Candidatus Krumholzibacteriota bacterium]|nr:Ig-like domain-containing protein [Candidatus Krumholzibacteriota bacterium]
MLKHFGFSLALIFVVAGLVIFCGCSEESADGPEPDTTPPTVVATEPADGAADVSRSGPFWVLFSEEMDKESVVDNMSFQPDGSLDIGYNTYWEGDTIFITPSSSLAGATDYIITVSELSEDLAENQLSDDYLINFTTTSLEDITPPDVLSTTPDDGAVDVTSVITVEIEFSEPVSVPSYDLETQSFITFDPYPDNGDISVEGSTLILQNLVFPQDTTVEITILGGSGNITDLADNPLATDYGFSFVIAADDTRPTLVSATPSNGAAGVSTGLSEMIFNFSEPMYPEINMLPENIDARIENAVSVSGNPWNSDYTSMTVPVLSDRVAPGCTYWVRFAAEDMAGNRIDPDPTPYEFTTSGTVSYFPVDNGNTWYLSRSGPSYEKHYILNYTPGDGTFDIVYEDSTGSGCEVYDIWHMKKTSTEIQMLGRTGYDDGSVSEEMTWDSPLTFYKLPILDNLDEQWALDTGFDMHVIEGETDTTFSATLTGTVTMASAPVDIVFNEGVLQGTFKSCAKHNLSITISVAHPDSGSVIMAQIDEDKFLAPGVGVIKQITDDLESSGIDTLSVERWEY